MIELVSTVACGVAVYLAVCTVLVALMVGVMRANGRRS